MRKKKIFRYTSILLGIVVLFLLGLILFSPYGNSEIYPHKALASSVVIDVPPAKVYSVLGSSENARLWSVFVHHISALNPEEVADGSVGSIRRCFGNEEETGLMWDEKTVINKPNLQRRLTIYNMKGFDMTSDHLRTDQLYEAQDGDKTKLTFTIFFDPDKEVSLMDHLKLYYSAYIARGIFEKNLSNIKYLAEEGTDYTRRFPFTGP